MRTPKFREDQFRDLFKEETPKTITPPRTEQNQPTPPDTRTPDTRTPDTRTADTRSAESPVASEEQKKPPVKQVNIVFEEIRRRLSLLPVGVDVEYFAEVAQRPSTRAQADEIRRFLKDHYREGLGLDEALQLGVRALTVTQNKTLSERDLEVAVLDRTKARRKFRRIPPEALAQLLGTAR